MFLFVGVIIALALIAASSKGGAPVSGGSSSGGAPAGSAPDDGAVSVEQGAVNAVRDVFEIAKKYGPEATAAALTVAGGAATGAILTNGSVGGTILGGLSPTWGVAAAGGSQIGKEIDKLLGGREEAASNQVAQAGGGILAGGLVAFGPILGPLMFVGVGQVIVLVYLVVVAIEDAIRLHSYGQSGALEDYWKQWMVMYGRGYDNLVGGVPVAVLDASGEKVRNADGTVKTATVILTDAEINRIMWPFTDGYMAQRNKNAFERWMRQPWGLGMTRGGHAKYGRDRGYFVGEVSAAGDLVVGPPKKSDLPEYVQFIPGGYVGNGDDVVTPEEVKQAIATGKTIAVSRPRYEWFETPVKATTTTLPSAFTLFQRGSPPVTAELKNPWFNAQGFTGPVFDSAKALRDGFIGTTWERKAVGTQVRYTDPARELIERAGTIAGNVGCYVEWMRHPWGSFQSASSHLVYGRDEGRFEGGNAGDGKLAYGTDPDTGAALVWDFRHYPEGA